MALDLLRRDPFAAGNHYPGDLLISVLRVESGFWRAHTKLFGRADEIAQSALSLLSESKEVDDHEMREMLNRDYDLFKLALKP